MPQKELNITQLPGGRAILVCTDPYMINKRYPDILLIFILREISLPDLTVRNVK